MNELAPKISIITASYNYADYIPKTIESIINQTYPNWELIVVDDGSSDNSVEIIESYCKKDSRIKLFQHKRGKNRGLKDTLLLGIKKSTSDWIAFCESDDYYTPNHLEEKVKVINKHKDANFIFNDYTILGNQDFQESPYYKVCQDTLKSNKGNADYSNICSKYNPVVTFSIVMLRKELLKNLDFNSPIKPILDYYLWAQLSSKTKFYYMDTPLSILIKHDGSYIEQANKNRFIFWLKMSCFLPKILYYKIRLTLCALF